MQTQTLDYPSDTASVATLNLSLGATHSSKASTGIERALHRAKQALLARQNPKGYWVGELQGDSILESEYILLMFILNLEDDGHLPKITNYLRNLQNPDGGWSLFPGGPADLSGTVKGYFAPQAHGR